MSKQPSELMVSIPELFAHIQSVLTKGFADSQFKIIGMVTRVFESPHGHIYLDLEDDNGKAISCVIFQNNTRDIGFNVEKNMRIEVVGFVGFYERDSKIQLQVEGVRLIENALLQDFEQLKKELSKRNLWPKRTIRKIPKKIHKIALVSGYQSKAIEDFRRSYQEHGGKAEIIPVEVSLQGDSAPREIAEAITRLNKEADVVGIVLTRGGGSPTDLSVFDHLMVAQAILESKIPILTGIGHEEDITFADVASDMRGGTPSALATNLAIHEVEVTKPTATLSPVIVGLIIIIVVLVITIVFVLASG